MLLEDLNYLLDSTQLNCSQSQTFLLRLGINGEILSTPGHSEDSITLILNDGIAFTGDLPLPEFATEEAKDKVTLRWEKIRTAHSEIIYPEHGSFKRLS